MKRNGDELKVVFTRAVWEPVKASTPPYATASISRQRRSVLLSRVRHSVGPVGTDTGGRYLGLGCNEPISWCK